MVTLTKLNGQQFTINADLIETFEQTPDTVIVMTTGNKYVVKESPEEIIDKIGADGFPSHLDLQDQGRFFVGFYHQQKAFYTKKEEQNESNNN